MFLLLVIIIIIAVFLIISVMKKLLKIALIFAIIFVILFFVTGGSIISEFSNLKDKINNEPAIVLLENDGDILTGFVDLKKLELLDKGKIASINSLYSDNKLKEIKEDNYKLFVIKTSVLNGLQDVKINNKDVSAQQIYDFFVKDQEITQITAEDIFLEIDVLDKISDKAVLFAYLYKKELKITKSPILFFKNYKKGKIIVYPETIFFRFTKIIPLAWIDEKLNKLKDTIVEKTRP